MEGSKWRILNAEPDSYSKEARRYLERFATVTELPTSQEELIGHLKGYHALIVRLGLQINRDVLIKAPELKVVISATTGTDHIDLEAATEYGIEILTLKGEREFLDSIPSTAEHTWALLLAVTRKIIPAHYQISKGDWDRQVLRGHNLKDKRLGILGMGRVGRQVTNIAQAFGMQIGAFDINHQGFPTGLKRFDSLTDLLSWCEILSIHVPLDSSTNHLLQYEQLSVLPKGSVVINTSRAGIWDEQAVVQLLQEEHLSAVATDVISHERDDRLRKESPLLNYQGSNLLVTPHIAGATFESMEHTEIFMARKLETFFNTLNEQV